jgi:hypothetical protein
VVSQIGGGRYSRECVPAGDFRAVGRAARQTQLNSSQTPDVDACGFEGYQFDCQECGTVLAGIIDPADDALILSICWQTIRNKRAEVGEPQAGEARAA